MKIKYISFLLILFIIISSCKIVQYVRFQKSDYHSKPKFKSNVINNDATNKFDFYNGDKEIENKIRNFKGSFTNSITEEKHRTTLEDFLSQHTETTAFLVIRNDTILYEKYFKGYDRNSQLPSFSIAKSFTSALIGIAIQEGFIESVHDPVTKYIPELKDKKRWWNELTIEHLLNMKSGLKYQNGNTKPKLPYFGIGQLYISKNTMRIIKRAKFKFKPGTHFNYSSLDNQILGIILQRVTDRSVSDLLEEKVWKKIGMHQSASWSIDSKRKQNTKSYCCLNATALDYARFGRLYLEGGYWNGESIVPNDWVKKTITVDFPDNDLQYQWWLKEYYFSKNPDSLSAAAKIHFPKKQYIKKVKNEWYAFNVYPQFSAEGAFGQYIFMNPKSNTIFVRLGKEDDIRGIKSVFNRIENVLRSN